MVQFVKLGGSVITEKAEGPIVREDVLARLAAEAAAATAAGTELILVHGAGSFGHPIAREANLKAGLHGEGAASAFARVHADVRRLNLAVLDALGEAGLDAATFSPFGLFGMNDGTPGGWNFVPIHRALGLGITPVTHGDAVLDTSRGITILSGDTILLEMVRLFRPERVVFVLDQDGAYDRPPHGPDGEEATLLEHPTVRELEEAAKYATAGRGPDVTGGMAGKLQVAAKLVGRGVPVAMVNGLVDGRLRDALAGKVTGTLAEPAADPDDDGEDGGHVDDDAEAA